MVDINLLSFFSEHPIDKIVEINEISIVNDGNTTGSGSGTGDSTARIVSESIANPYGRAALVRAKWSIDGGNNWQALEARLNYAFTITITDFGVTSPPLRGLQAAISIGCSDSSIIFRTANGYHGNVSRTFAAPATSGYTPISQTFLIKYWVYERE